jgi:predicted nucleic acid-binding protein
MILLDTNVISEPMRQDPDPRVVRWLDNQVAETLFTTSVTLAELLAGIAVLPERKRKRGLEDKLARLISTLFGPRILSFDVNAAEAYAKIVRDARANGVSIAFPDGQIAAIASVQGFALATRDLIPFSAAGIPLINPWDQ